jgi:hypothetical protein
LHGPEAVGVGVVTLGVGVIEANRVGVAVAVFVAVALGVAVAFTVAVAATVALTVGVAVGLVGDVQPATNKEATTSERTIIAVIDLNCICLCKW